MSTGIDLYLSYVGRYLGGRAPVFHAEGPGS